MAKRIRLEVSPRDHWWRVTRDGQLWDAYSLKADTVREAIRLAHELANAGELVTLKIKRKDGTIIEERTYPRSSDPRRTKG